MKLVSHPYGGLTNPRPFPQASIRAAALSLLVLGTTMAGGGCTRRPAQPSVLVVVVDTLRADMVGALRTVSGGAPSPTPVLDRFAEGAARFRRASTPAPFTMPAMASLWTGAYPDRCGVVTHESGVSLKSWSGPTLAEEARAAGLLTAAVVANPWLARVSTGFDRGFDHFERLHSPTRGPTDNKASTVTDHAIARLKESGDRPFLLWVHYFDPHMAYEPPLEFARAAGAADTDSRIMSDFRSPDRDLRRLYRGVGYDEAEIAKARLLYQAEVSATDHEIGRLFEQLENQGLADNTVVIVVADHGESLGQHGLFFAHDYTVYEELVHVPLLVRGPGVAAQTHDERVSLVDIAPTVCHLASLSCADAVDGRDLFWSSPRTLFAAATPRRPKGTAFDGLTVPGLAGRWTMALRDQLKLVRIPRAEGPRLELYDLASDPGEQHDLAAARPADVDALAKELERWTGEMNAARPPLPVPRRQRRRDTETLRSLGYLQ